MSAWILRHCALRPLSWLGLIVLTSAIALLALIEHKWDDAFHAAFLGCIYAIAWAYSVEFEKARKR